MLKFGNDDFFDRCKYHMPAAMHSPHTHDYHELYFLENGQTTYFVENSIYIINAGDFIFIEDGKFHQTDSSRSPYIERVIINFDNKFLGEDYISLLNEIKENPHIRLPEAEVPRFKKLLNKIEKEASSDEENTEILQRIYLYELLVLILRYRKHEFVQNFSNTYKIAQDLANFISTNYRQQIDLALLAQTYSVSSGYLSKLFKKYTGIGVNHYINICRVRAAKELFESTDMSVTEAAYECGFNDSNYFSQVFKKETGYTPKKYSVMFKNKSTEL